MGSSPRIIRAFSEDCAVLKLAGKDQYLLATTDVLVEGVHFSKEYASFYEIGRKALRVNISDISAMGGSPTFFLVSLGCDPKMNLGSIRSLYRGMRSGAGDTGVQLIGGNVSEAPVLFLDIMMLGEVDRNSIVLRSGARKGDRIFVSGPLGASSAGLYLLQQRVSPQVKRSQRGAGRLIRCHLNPPCRNRIARTLAASGLLSSMIDLSDGLVSDLQEISRESGCGAIIHLPSVPVAKEIAMSIKDRKRNPLDFALYGGEDYELLFTIPEKHCKQFSRLIRRKRIGVFPVGKMAGRRGTVRGCDEQGTIVPLQKGFEHWKKS